jgi:hypothetical protein
MFSSALMISYDPQSFIEGPWFHTIVQGFLFYLTTLLIQINNINFPNFNPQHLRTMLCALIQKLLTIKMTVQYKLLTINKKNFFRIL